MFLTDGFSTIVTIAALPGVFLREREVQPPSLKQGGAIDTHTMRDTRFLTQDSKRLIRVGDITMQCQYDPFVYPQIVTILGARTTFLITFPDGGTLTIWGALEEFNPPSHKEGEFPLVEVKIIAHNRNSAGTETGPASMAGVSPGGVIR